MAEFRSRRGCSLPGQTKLGYRVLDVLADKLGSARGIAIIGSVEPEEVENARRFLDRYGAMPL